MQAFNSIQELVGEKNKNNGDIENLMPLAKLLGVDYGTNTND